jgi:hypothetical protein
MMLGACVLASGCNEAPTIWETEVPSPDGRWIASACTIQNGGFGSAHIDTIVFLKQSNVSKPPTEVLGFNCHGPAPRPYVLDNANAGGTIDLSMKWVTPSHLAVTYNGRAGELDFQVVKIAAINITVRDLSSEPTNGKDTN